MSELISAGYQVLDAYLSAESCEALLADVAAFRQQNELMEIHRPMKDRSLRYFVIDGNQIQGSLTRIWEMYHGEVYDLMRQLSGEDIVPLQNRRAGVNVNIMPPGRSSYRWHYDRCSVTAILYLNQVGGGHTEFYPNYRLLLKNGAPAGVQRALDGLVNIPAIRSRVRNMQAVKPRPGRLVVMRGNRCWHSVQPVTGDQDRINIIFSYDHRNALIPAKQDLDQYLYTDKHSGSGDPNYGK